MYILYLGNYFHYRILYVLLYVRLILLIKIRIAYVKLYIILSTKRKFSSRNCPFIHLFQLQELYNDKKNWYTVWRIQLLTTVCDIFIQTTLWINFQIIFFNLTTTFLYCYSRRNVTFLLMLEKSIVYLYSSNIFRFNIKSITIKV